MSVPPKLEFTRKYSSQQDPLHCQSSDHTAKDLDRKNPGINENHCFLKASTGVSLFTPEG